MTTEILYPVALDDGFLDWTINSGGINRYDAINEGTTQPDVVDFIRLSTANDLLFDDLYESGVLYEDVKPYYETVRVNLGEMSVWGTDSLKLNLFAAQQDIDYYGSPRWGLGSFDSEGDYLINYWTMDDAVGLVSDITPGFVWSNSFSPDPVTFVTGKVGDSTYFNGESYLSSGIGTTLNPRYRLDSGKSFGGWIYNSKSSGDALIFAMGDGTARNSVYTLKLVDGGAMEFTIYRSLVDSNNLLYGQAVKTLSVPAPELNRWSFVICTIDATNRKIKISINGEAYEEATYTNYNMNENFSSAFLGGNPAVTFFGDLEDQSIDASYFVGKIDEWAMWGNDLNIEQVVEIYNGGVGRTYPLPSFTKKHYTTLYDNNGLEIASIPPSPISSSGDLISVDSFTPALYEFNLSDTSQQQDSWINYDLSNVYVDLQLFTEKSNGSALSKSTGDAVAFSASNLAPEAQVDAWTGTANTKVADGSYASVTGSTDDSMNLYLYNFGFALPDDASITAVDLQMTTKFAEEPGGASNNPLLKLQLCSDSTTYIGDPQSGVGLWFYPDDAESTVDTNVLDTWGANLTPTIVNSSDFGVQCLFRVDGTKPYSMSIDHLALNIRYRVPGISRTAIISTIFTLDLDVDGELVSHNTMPMYLHNTIEPDETTLHTISTAPGSGETTLTTIGHTDSSDSTTLFQHGQTDDSDNIALYTKGSKSKTTPLFIHGHEEESTGMTLHTVGGLYDSGSVDLIMQNKKALLDCPLYISAHDSETGDVPLNIFGKVLDSESTTCYVKGQIITDLDGNMNMSITGYGGDTSGDVPFNIWATENPGIRDITNFYMKADNSGERDSYMNMYIESPDIGDITSNMNMFLNSDAPVIGDGTSFFIANNFDNDSGNTTMFISAPGTTDGAVPSNSNMNLFMARDQQYNWRQTPLYMLVPSGEETASTPLYINSVLSEDKTMTISMANVTSPESGDMPLYTNGF